MAYQTYNRAGEPNPPKRLKRMSRAKAEKMVSALLDRARTINADVPWPLYVRKLSLFGSIISDAPDLGDLDIAFLLGRKPNWSIDYVLTLAKANSSANTLFRQLYWCERQTASRLRARNAYISLHRYEEVEPLGCDLRVILEVGE